MKYILYILLFCVSVFAQDATPDETKEAAEKTINIEISPSGEFVKGTVVLSVETEASAIAFFRNGEKIGDGVSQDNKWQYKWDSTKVSDGSYELHALINEEQKTPLITCKVDNNAPTITTKVTPLRGKAEAYIEIQDSNPYEAQVTINGKNHAYDANTKKITWETVSGEEYIILVTAVDAAQNASEKKTIFTAALEDISLEVIKSFPTESNTSVACQIKTNAENVMCYLSENPDVQAEVENKGDYYEIVWNPEDDGLFTLVLFLENSSGKTKEQSFAVRIDTNPPQVTLAENQSITNNENIKIDAKIQDASYIQEAVLFQNDEQVAKLENKDDRWVWEGKLTNEGVHSFYIKSKDILGNEGKSTTTKCIFDRTAPTIQNVQITPQQLQIGLVNIEVSYEDSNSGISPDNAIKIFLEIDGTPRYFEMVETKEGSCSAELTITEDYAVGEYAIYITNLKDLAGNSLAKTSLGSVQIIEKQDSNGNWPLIPQDQIPQVTVNEQTNALLLSGKSQQDVVCIEDGMITAIQSCSNELGYVIVESLRGGSAWAYYNIKPHKHPNEKRYWALGDAIKKGDAIGTLSKDSPLKIQFLTKDGDAWAVSANALENLKPQATEYEQVSESPSKAVAKIQLPEKLQTSDWLLISYLVLFVALMLALVMPKKVKI